MRRFFNRVPRTILIVALVLIAILVAARAALPWAIKSYANKTLDSIPGYYGHIDDVDVALWRGAYRVEGVSLMKTHGKASEPFFSARRIDIALDWSALLQRRIVTRVTLERPQLQFIQRESKAASQTSIDDSWQAKVAKLVPFQINRFRIVDGLIRYEDKTSEPRINLYFQNLALNAENISNATHSSAALPSKIDLQSRFLNSGWLHLSGDMNLLADPLEADVKASLDRLRLKELNDFAKAYGKFDFEKGELDVTMELAASKTNYEGYVKTLARDIDVLDLSKESKEGESVGNLVWQGLVGAVMAVFKNHGNDKFAARIPISGSRAKMKIDSWATVGSILRNTFVRAITPKFENNVDYADVAPRGKGSASGATSSAREEEQKAGKRESSGLHVLPPKQRKNKK